MFVIAFRSRLCVARLCVTSSCGQIVGVVAVRRYAAVTNSLIHSAPIFLELWIFYMGREIRRVHAFDEYLVTILQKKKKKQS